MATRKWTAEILGRWIGETARARLEEKERRPVSDTAAELQRLAELDSIGLQSLGARLGAALWQSRLDAAPPDVLETELARARAESDGLAIAPRALLRTLNALRYALAAGDRPMEPSADPVSLSNLAARIIRGRATPDTLADVAFVRSLIEPLLGGDRSTFHRLLGAISGTLIQLEFASQDGRLANVRDLPPYWELKALQWTLNGVLQASRSRASRPERSRVLSA